MLKRYFLYPLAICCAIASPAHAVETKISGFLSASLTMLDSDEVEYANTNDYPTFNDDNILGIQIDSAIDDSLVLTGQLVAKDAGDGEGFHVTAPWAYLTYAPQPNHRFRAGRMALSYYNYSDSLNVSYSYPWIRTPAELYGDLLIPSYEGVEYTNFSNLGHMDVEFVLRAGGFADEIEHGGSTISVKSKTYWGASTRLLYNDLSLRISYARPRLEMKNPAIDGFLATLEGMGESALIEDLYNDDTPINFYNMSLHYDSLNLLLFAEGVMVERENGSIPEQTAYYLGGGYHFGNWLPTITFASRDDDTRTDLIGNTANPVAEAMVTGFVEAFEQDQESITLSLRWDFHKATALKFEVQHIKPKSGTNGMLDVVDAAYKQDAVNLYGISISSTF